MPREVYVLTKSCFRSQKWMILFISDHYPNAFHTLESTGVVNQNCKVLACYVGDLNEAAKEYDAVVKLQFESHDDANEFVSKQAQLLKSNKQSSPLIVFRSDTKTRLHDIVLEESEFAETLRCFVGHSDDYYPFLTTKMKFYARSILMSIIPKVYILVHVRRRAKCLSVSRSNQKAWFCSQVSKSKAWM